MIFVNTRQFLSLILIATCTFYCVIGCGKSRPRTIQIEGKVTLNGGKWPGKGTLHFQSIQPAPGYPQRPGMGIFDVEGNFKAGTYALDDGLFPGEYDVEVSYETPYISGSDPPPNSIMISGKDKLKVSPDAKGPIKYQFDVKHK